MTGESLPGAWLDQLRTGLRTTWILAKRTVHDSVDDRVPGLAAEVSFYLLLSLPPFLLVGLGALGYVGDLFGPDAVVTVQQQIINGAARVLTAETVDDVVRPAVEGLLARGRADILSLGAVLALWSGSRALRVIVQAITIAYDMEDRRTWWQHRLLGVALTVAGILTLAILLPLLVVGPRAGEAFAGRFGLERAFEVAWSALYFPVVVVLGLTLLTWVYHVVPPHSTRWRRDLPGAVLALLLWLAGSAGLRIYATQVATTESAYAYFGTPLVLMLWIYLTAVTFLVGAEFNAEIEKMHPSARSASQRSDPDRRGTRTRRGVSSRRTGQRDE
ncbi:MAG TPA: YihY/virulence factor BrkB family protein [Acidimicrobiia bacterium]|jgi:membrane protein|nr:YihY/virulence factor BrkB family protein [Acidimicrobiia bacterium]